MEGLVNISLAKKKKQKPCIIVDTREKTPLWLPGEYKDFDVVSQKLDTGDYSVEGMEKILVVERKASGHELFANFTKGRARFYREIARMKDIPMSFVVIEQDLGTLMNPVSYRYVGNQRNACGMVVSSLMSLMLRNNIHVIFAGKSAKSFISKILTKAYENFEKGMFDHE